MGDIRKSITLRFLLGILKKTTGAYDYDIYLRENVKPEPRWHRDSAAGSIASYRNRLSAINASVTVIAPPMRVATWANGSSSIRFAAVRIAISPVPPWPL